MRNGWQGHRGVRALGFAALVCRLRNVGLGCHILAGRVHWHQVDQGCQ